MEELIKNLIDKRVLIIDGAMGTQLQIADIKKEEWFFEDLDLEGCNELLNLTAPHILETIHDNWFFNLSISASFASSTKSFQLMDAVSVSMVTVGSSALAVSVGAVLLSLL